MHISAAQSEIWQQDAQNHWLFDAMETVLLTVVEADDHKNQRSVNYFSTFFIKNKQINKKPFCRLQMVKLDHHFQRIPTSFSYG